MSKIVGIGACVMDTLVSVPNYPTEDTKLRADGIMLMYRIQTEFETRRGVFMKKIFMFVMAFAIVLFFIYNLPIYYLQLTYYLVILQFTKPQCRNLINH